MTAIKQPEFVLDNGMSCTVFSKGSRPALEVDNSFSFLINVATVMNSVSETKLNLASGHEIRQATEGEVLAIKDELSAFLMGQGYEPWENGGWVKGKGTSTFRPKLPKDKWRYFVIGFNGSNSTIVEIERALHLSEVELKIGFTVLPAAFPNSPMVIYHPGRLFSLLASFREGNLQCFEITSKVAANIRFLSDEVRTADEKLAGVSRLIQQVMDLDALPHESQLIFLGYFAILESLITHQPKKTDTIDSITRQVKKKVALLDNRWQPRIDYSAFQQGKTPDSIWSDMYAYRSCLAHGGEPDFKSELQVLKDGDRALKLLKQTVKAVLRQALSEPQLIIDLRNC